MCKLICGFRLLILILIGITSLLSTNSVLASQALLEDFFGNVQTLQADFEQKVIDETGMLLEFSSGQFSLSRPGKFKWDYRSTDPEFASGQQIVADGESIFMYDPDLEQVTKRKLTDALGQVPSLMLVQNSASIVEHFSVIDIGLTDGLSWVSLKPLDEDAGYQSLMLGFLGKSLNTIVLLDGLGNETRLSLSKVENNKKLPADTFDFKVPAGADLLEG